MMKTNRKTECVWEKWRFAFLFVDVSISIDYSNGCWTWRSFTIGKSIWSWRFRWELRLESRHLFSKLFDFLMLIILSRTIWRLIEDEQNERNEMFVKFCHVFIDSCFCLPLFVCWNVRLGFQSSKIVNDYYFFLVRFFFEGRAFCIFSCSFCFVCVCAFFMIINLFLSLCVDRFGNKRYPEKKSRIQLERVLD